MVIHISGQNWGTVDIHSSAWQVFNILDACTHWAVPVFIMISGALFLGRNIVMDSTQGNAGIGGSLDGSGSDRPLTLKTLYSKYVLRLVTAFVFWSILYAFLGAENGQSRLHRIFIGHYHMWFILMLAGIYICLPFLAMIAQNEKLCNYYLLISFICTFAVPQFRLICTDFAPTFILRISEALNQFVNNFGINFILGYSFYFVLGYKLSIMDFRGKQNGCEQTTHNRAIPLWPILTIGAIGLIITPLLTHIRSMQLGYGYLDYYGNFTLNMLASSAAIFVGFKEFTGKRNQSDATQESASIVEQTLDSNSKVATGISKPRVSISTTLSNWSFGAYLVHALILELLGTALGLNTLTLGQTAIGALGATILLTIIIFIVSFAISGILHQIPVVKKYLV